MSAVARGTAAAIQDPESAVDTLEESVETNPETSRRAVHAQVEATLPLLSRSGYVSPSRADELVGWMHGQGLIRRELPASTLLTDSYLP
jgi:hypothetical protein